MNRKQHQKPFYRRPWLWIVVALLLVGGGWFISNHNQAQKTQRDSVVKTTTESDKKKKPTKEGLRALLWRAPPLHPANFLKKV